jgi:stress response protein YsnF
VVKEEVRVSKTSHVDQRSVDATVRREEVDVKEDDDDDARTTYAQDDGSASHI